MTRRQRILLSLAPNREMSCWELVMATCGVDVDTTNKWKMNNLNASVSSTLNLMVKRGELEYSPNKTKRGGHIYKLKGK